MNNEYVDIPPDLMGNTDPDQQWIEQQLDRIDPWRHEQGHDGADEMALRVLALVLRTQRDILGKAMNEIAAWQDGKVGAHMDEPGIGQHRPKSTQGGWDKAGCGMSATHIEKTGGPAFPSGLQEVEPDTVESLHKGMTLRDYFAAKAPTDEVQELLFRHLSRIAQEQLTGMKYPEKPAYTPNDPNMIAFQIAEFEFKCAVNAAIRFKLADAMLKARTA